ncbi:hypothetical protein, partial [Plasmodium yoelii yoelii]
NPQEMKPFLSEESIKYHYNFATKHPELKNMSLEGIK